MDITFTVRLPVDTTSVPFVRGLCRQALRHLRVERDVVDQIALALTEACANVVQHAGAGDSYEVSVAIEDRMCRIGVVDEGGGFEPAAADPDPSSVDDGRGLQLMQALVDRLDFQRGPDGRHRVVLEKRLAPGPALRLVDPV